MLLHVPSSAALGELVDDVRAVARSHGIGLITAGDPSDYTTWEELEEAVRVEPDPERLDQFIDVQLSEKVKNKIAKALR